MALQSECSLPHLGLGMAALGRPGYINLDRSSTFGFKQRSIDRMQQQSNLVMDYLFHCARSSNMLPWLDCARSYGLSEKFVGDYLRSKQIAPDSVHVSSKWGYTYVADFQVALPEGAPHEIKDHSIENFIKQLREIESLLDEYIDLYQIHSATFESGVLSDPKVHDALAKCKKERGWMIGLSVSSPKQDLVIREAMKITIGEEKTRLFDSVQCTYNLLEQRPGAALQEAHEAGMDIIIKEGLANGRPLRYPAVIKFSESARPASIGDNPSAPIQTSRFIGRYLTAAARVKLQSDRLTREVPSGSFASERNHACMSCSQ